MLLLMTVYPLVHAHTDLQLQIEELTSQLAHDPDNAELLLRRGDLQRRHEQWDSARADFQRVRELQPGNENIDWFEGRLEVQAGRPVEGVHFLDRFLAANPEHLIALQNRAQGFMMLNRPLLAANDYQAVIHASGKPTPSLYSVNALALVRAGAGHWSAAMEVLLQGLSVFPAEVTLSAIATDLSLAQTDTDTARRLMSELPASVLNLPQWQTRGALLECLSGHPAIAAFRFSSLAGISPQPGSRAVPLSAAWLARLAAEPEPGNCQAAAVDVVKNITE